MDENKCEICGAKLIYSKKGNCLSITCPNCGYGVATSYFEPYEVDTTIYNVTLNKKDKLSTKELRLISNLIGENYLNTTSLMKEGKVSFKEECIKIVNKLIFLKHNGIEYSITPNFPYDLDFIKKDLKKNENYD